MNSLMVTVWVEHPDDNNAARWLSELLMQAI